MRHVKPKLDETKSKMFHRFTETFMYASKRARGYISYVVSFLTNRVQNPDEDDWNKLTRVVRYTNYTLNLCLTIQADEYTVVKW